MQQLENLQKNIEKLSVTQALVFGLHLTKRLLPNYLFFVKTEKRGDAFILKNIIDFVEKRLLNEKSNYNSLNLKQSILAIAPSSENFPSVYSTYALDCCAAFDDLLSFIQTQNKEYILSISMLSINTVYIFLVDRFFTTKGKEPSEEEIYSSEDMKNEVTFQEKLLKNIQAESNTRELIRNAISILYEGNINLKYKQ